MEITKAENGYESPTDALAGGSIASGITCLKLDSERRRTVNGEAQIESPTPESSALFQQQDKDEEKTKYFKKVSIRDRIGCFTWTWFTMTMATGGIANILHAVPYRSDWLNTIGIIFFLFNICLFLFNCLAISLRFILHRGSLRASFTEQSESLFIPAILVSTGIICTNICQYGIPNTGPWLQSTMAVVFWIYSGVSMLASSGIYLMLWSTQAFPIHTMTPIWIFPAYPLLLAAPFASNLIDSVPTVDDAQRINAVALTFGAIVLQGTGFLLSIMICGAFIYRLMTQKLPQEPLRPGIFVSVGPSGFTASGLVHLGNVLTKTMPDGYLGNSSATFVLKVISDLLGLWLWGLCIWFFLVSVGSHWTVLFHRGKKEKLNFNMTWYSFVFPNTALITATFNIGKSLEARPILILGCTLSGLLIVVWVVVFSTMIRGLWLKRLLWP